MTEPITIPDDIAEALGELTEKQQGVLSRLLQAVGEERTHELIDQARQKLAELEAGPPLPNAPKTVRAVLWSMLMADALDFSTRIQVMGLPAAAPPSQKQSGVLAERLGETGRGPRQKIHQLITLVGRELVKATIAEAEQIEAQGGMLTVDGTRRRTLGGIFFLLIKPLLTPEQRREIFPAPYKRKYANRPGKPQAHVAAVAPAEPALPDRSAFVWAERKGLYHELTSQSGAGGSMKITLMGRPGKVIEKQDVVITSITVDKKPALPKGVPAPLPTTYSVYIGRKQWAKVAEAITNPEDSLIIEGVACYDPDMEGIMVSASTITTKLLQQAKKQPTAPADASTAAVEP